MSFVGNYATLIAEGEKEQGPKQYTNTAPNYQCPAPVTFFVFHALCSF